MAKGDALLLQLKKSDDMYYAMFFAVKSLDSFDFNAG
jgi:hypothetical protein